MIVEPVVQGAGGMRFHDPGYLRVLRQACDEHDVLLIFDEIATGFGRTGALFAADHAGVSPDVMCLGKALTGGYLSLAATLCTARVAAGISRRGAAGARARPHLHGQPAGLRGRERVHRHAARRLPGGWRRRSPGSKPGCAPGWPRSPDCPGVADVRVLGAIGVVAARSRGGHGRRDQGGRRGGVWLRPFRDLIYTMPPYITSDEDLARVYRWCARRRDGRVTPAPGNSATCC